MAFNGLYQVKRSEGKEEFMIAVGRPGLVNTSADDGKYEIEENGEYFKMTIKRGSMIQSNSFTIGEEAEMDMMTGERIKTVVNREGDKKLSCFLDKIKCSFELLDSNTLLVTLMAGDISYKRFCKRIA